jgi:8-oxo-dGTP diphosphatase
MKSYNCIIILNKEKDKILFCKRMSDPYYGLYNFVGGKIEEGEESLEAAYRELEEETGITKKHTTLQPFIDYVWHIQEIRMEVYVGVLNKEIVLREEKHPLHWLDFSYNFFDMKVFAGEGNIGHMIEILKMSDV